MGRVSGGSPQIIVKPKNNVYTVLAAIGLVVVIAGLVALFMRASVLLPNSGLFQ